MAENKLLEKIKHPFEPIWDENSKVLILGSFPSEISREKMFYYANPQNRFWKVMAAIYQEPELKTDKEKTDFILRHHLALWDVVSSCFVKGSSDASLEALGYNEISKLVLNSRISDVFLNGSLAYSLFMSEVIPASLTPHKLPSTSSANAAFSFEKLVQAYRLIKETAERYLSIIVSLRKGIYGGDRKKRRETRSSESR
jgi:TDG/mug DNA glycosylase family protein